MPNARTRNAGRAVLTATGACVAALVLTGCFNAIDVTDAGQLGVTVDAAGDPVLMLMLCEKGSPYVLLAEGRKASDPASKRNAQRGEWTTDSTFKGVQELSLTRPATRWTTRRSPGALGPDVLLIADGGTAEDDTASLVPVDFRPRDLAKLRPGQVLTSSGTVSAAAFSSYRCED